MDYILLLLGFLLLIKGADAFVDGSSSVAKILKIPTIIIGLTVVAFGTSMPEFSVSLTAAMKGSNDLAVSNVLGSNIFNLLVVLGACSLIRPVQAKSSLLKKEFPFSIFIAVILLLLDSDFSIFKVLEGEGTFTLGRLGGILFLILFAVFLYATVKTALRSRDEMVDEEEYKVMSPVKSALYIIIGLAGIIWGGDLVVDSACSIAETFGLSQTFIGLTIVAVGTSLPELVTSMVAAGKGENDLAVGNVVGSNIFNLMFVIGVCSILSTIYVQRETVTRDIPFSIICALLLLGLGMIAVGDASGMTLGHFDGILFLILFAGYIGLMIKSAMKARAEGKEVEANDEFDAEELKVMSYPKSIIYIVGGAIAIAIGGDLTVDTASRIAIDLGMSQTLVGLTIVSIGTSLPELVTSVVAARKNEVDMAVGNAVGSNIFNILMVLGIASAINPVSLIRENVIDIIILVVFSVVVWIFAATKKKISRKEGIAMVAMYLVYAVYIILR